LLLTPQSPQAESVSKHNISLLAAPKQFFWRTTIGSKAKPALIARKAADYRLAYDTRCRKTGSPRLLAYMGRYRSVLYMVATSSLRGPSLGSGMGTSS